MTAVAQTSEPTNLPTGAERLLAFARWLIILFLVHRLIVRGRKFATYLRQHPTAADHAQFARRFGTNDRARVLARINRGLHRAAVLEAELLARSPTQDGMPEDVRRAIAAAIDDICADLGFFRARPTRAVVHVHRALRRFVADPASLTIAQLPPTLVSPCKSRGPPASPSWPSSGSTRGSARPSTS